MEQQRKTAKKHFVSKPSHAMPDVILIRLPSRYKLKLLMSMKFEYIGITVGTIAK
jgi:hypothetical protein